MNPSHAATSSLKVVQSRQPSTLERLAADYIEDRMAARLSVRTIENDIRPRLERIFLAWCADNGVTEPGQLDQKKGRHVPPLLRICAQAATRGRPRRPADTRPRPSSTACDVSSANRASWAMWSSTFLVAPWY